MHSSWDQKLGKVLRDFFEFFITFLWFAWWFCVVVGFILGGLYVCTLVVSVAWHSFP